MALVTKTALNVKVGDRVQVGPAHWDSITGIDHLDHNQTVNIEWASGTRSTLHFGAPLVLDEVHRHVVTIDPAEVERAENERAWVDETGVTWRIDSVEEFTSPGTRDRNWALRCHRPAD